MKIQKALLIFDNIESEDFTEEEKAIAIKMVLNMPTKNSITKDNICKAFLWMWDQFYELDGEQDG